MAMGVFGLVMVAVIGMISANQQAQVQGRYYDIAASSARRIVETARNGGYDSLVAGQTYSRTASLPEGLPGGAASMTISMPTGATEVKRIDVDVSYTVGATTRHAYSSAMIGKGGITP